MYGFRQVSDTTYVGRGSRTLRHLRTDLLKLSYASEPDALDTLDLGSSSGAQEDVPKGTDESNVALSQGSHIDGKVMQKTA